MTHRCTQWRHDAIRDQIEATLGGLGWETHVEHMSGGKYMDVVARPDRYSDWLVIEIKRGPLDRGGITQGVKQLRLQGEALARRWARPMRVAALILTAPEILTVWPDAATRHPDVLVLTVHELLARAVDGGPWTSGPCGRGRVAASRRPSPASL